MEATCAVQDFIITDEFLGNLTQGEQEEEVELLQARADVIREAQDVWAKLNSCLHYLGPLPPDVLVGWDRIKPWLNQQARDVMHSIEYQHQTESDVVWKWS
ncbi:MAG: hypothetical protein ACYC6G_00835 [Desulfobaccales bacterium]